MDDVDVLPDSKKQQVAGGVYECELWIYSDSVRMASLEVSAVENRRPSSNGAYIAVLGSTNPETCSRLCLPRPLS